jgi:hypothetical protein
LRGSANERRRRVCQPRGDHAEERGKIDLLFDPLIERRKPGMGLGQATPDARFDLRLNDDRSLCGFADEPPDHEQCGRHDDQRDDQNGDRCRDRSVLQPVLDRSMSPREQDRQHQRPGDGGEERGS